MEYRYERKNTTRPSSSSPSFLDERSMHSRSKVAAIMRLLGAEAMGVLVRKYFRFL